MARPPCIIDGCGKPNAGRGWCATHWMRWKRTGSTDDPTLTPRGHGFTPLDERLERNIDRSGDCWIWTGATSATGYAYRYVGGAEGDGRVALVHRLMYERHVGPIPDGYVVDHLCNVPRCVNPTHLEAVTQGENLLRAYRRDGRPSRRGRPRRNP